MYHVQLIYLSTWSVHLYVHVSNIYYCTISINLSGGVTCDQLDEISPPASQHVTWDKPEISAKTTIPMKKRSRNAYLVSLCSIVLWLSNSEQSSLKCFLLSKIQLG